MVRTVLDAPRDEVFEYMADIENLPRWATEFARELKRDADGYRIVNGLGEFCFDIEADRATGVIDMLAGPDRTDMALFPPVRSGCPTGRTAYSFTMFQGPGMTAELFEAQHRSLLREFANIEAAFAR